MFGLGPIHCKTQESREVIRNHLDAHKWAQSAFSTEQFKGSRWMLTASPKASACPPELRKCLTVTPHSQALHLRLVIKMFLDQGRRLRASARARARLSSAQFDLICDFACVFSHVWEEARLLASWNEDKEQAMAKAFFQRILGFASFSWYTFKDSQGWYSFQLTPLIFCELPLKCGPISGTMQQRSRLR